MRDLVLEMLTTSVLCCLHPDSDIVVAFKSAGFQWGGEIAGKQKDFMHFSLTGY